MTGLTQPRRNPAGRIARRGLPVAGVWLVAAAALQEVTGRVTDWFVMTDELLYERLAISAARTLSPVPTLRGVRSSSIDQLYPLLIAPFFRHGTVVHDLHRAHVFGAVLMSSASVPAYLLTRRVTRYIWAAVLVALLSVCVPWIVYSSFLLTEVVAYPAFAWAMLLLHRALARPCGRNDALALVGLGLAFLARTQFVVLVAVLPAALVALELRPRGVRAILRGHRVLVAAYAIGAIGVVGLAASGHSGLALGSYGSTVHGTLVPHGILRSLVQHLATLALGIGILPVVVGGAWLTANVAPAEGQPERRAFACLGLVTVVLVVLEATVFDLRLGVGLIVYDRYLFYLVPVFLVATVCAVTGARAPRWSLVVPAGLVAAGFALDALPRFQWSEFATLDPDAPVAGLYRPLVHLAGSLGHLRAGLAILTILLAGAFALCARALRRSWLTAGTAAFVLAVLPLATGYDFYRLLEAPDWANRALTGNGNGTGSLGWVDASVGADGPVTIVPYSVSSAYLVNLRYWRDLEFWNKSIARNAEYPALDQYAFTGGGFPKLLLSFDPKTGASSVSPTPYVIQSVTESRFRLAGKVRLQTQEVMLIDAAVPWRLAWIASGLTDDGWMQPGIPARIRLYPNAGQRGPLLFSLNLQFRAPDNVTERRFRIVSNVARVSGVATDTDSTNARIDVCVPAHGHGDVTIAAPGSSPIPGDLSSLSRSLVTTRKGSMLVADTSVSDDTHGRCTP